MKDALESLEMSKERSRLQKQEEEEEQKVIDIYLKIKQRMECLRKKKELEVRGRFHPRVMSDSTATS